MCNYCSTPIIYNCTKSELYKKSPVYEISSFYQNFYTHRNNITRIWRVTHFAYKNICLFALFDVFIKSVCYAYWSSWTLKILRPTRIFTLDIWKGFWLVHGKYNRSQVIWQNQRLKIFDRFHVVGLIIACIGTFIVAFLLEALNAFFYSMNIPKISLKSTKFQEMLNLKSESRQSSSESIQESNASVDESIATIHHCTKPPPPELQKPATVLENTIKFFDRYIHTYLNFDRNINLRLLYLLVGQYFS